MKTVLVNFRISYDLLEQFDGICRLSGVTRTQLLLGLIRKHVREKGASLPQHIEENRRITTLIRNALKKRDHGRLVSNARNRKIGAPRRLKSFSQHISEQGV